MSKARFSYNVCNFILESEFELVELTPLDHKSPEIERVKLTRGSVPSALTDAHNFGWIEANERACLFKINPQSRLIVVGRNEIVIEPGSLSPREVGAYVVGCGLPTLAHFRRYVPLHVSMAATAAGVVIFTGPSGAGKSTAVAALSKRLGWDLLCDDIAIAATGSTETSIYFDVSKIKLWKDAIEGLGIGSSGLQTDLIRPEKFHMPIPSAASVRASAVQAVFQLAWSEGAELRPISQPKIFQSLMNSVHAPFLLPIIGDLSVLHGVALEIADKAHGFMLCRNKTGSLDDQIDMIIGAMATKKRPA